MYFDIPTFKSIEILREVAENRTRDKGAYLLAKRAWSLFQGQGGASMSGVGATMITGV